MDRHIAYLYLVGGSGTRIKQMFPHYHKPLIPLDQSAPSSLGRDSSRLISYSLRHNNNSNRHPDVFAAGRLDTRQRGAVSRFATNRLIRSGMRPNGYVANVASESKRGIANAVVDAFDQFPGVDDFVVVNSDELRLDFEGRPVDFSPFINDYQFRHSKLSREKGSLFVVGAEDYHLHRVVEISSQDEVCSTRLLNAGSAAGNGHDAENCHSVQQVGMYESMPVFAGACIIPRSVAPHLNTENTGWAGVINPLVEAGNMSSYYDLRVKHYINAGTPEEYEAAVELMEGGFQSKEARV